MKKSQSTADIAPHSPAKTHSGPLTEEEFDAQYELVCLEELKPDADSEFHGLALARWRYHRIETVQDERVLDGFRKKYWVEDRPVRPLEALGVLCKLYQPEGSHSGAGIDRNDRNDMTKFIAWLQDNLVEKFEER